MMGPRFREFAGEVLGTFFLVLLGCGALAGSVLFNAHQGLMQIALAWGIAVTLAVYLTRHICCAHLNPAVTLAMVIAGRMPLRLLPTYLLGQLVGAFLAGLTVYILFGPSIALFEHTHGIVRGTPESVATATMFGVYYAHPSSTAVVSLPLALGAEALGAFLLVLMVFALTEGPNVGRPPTALTPLLIGLTVTAIIVFIAPLTQAGLNPARDFGPRMVAWIFGWGQAAFPDPHGGFLLVYILGPMLGGALAALLFIKLLKPAMMGVARGHNAESDKSQRL